MQLALQLLYTQSLRELSHSVWSDFPSSELFSKDRLDLIVSLLGGGPSNPAS